MQYMLLIYSDPSTAPAWGTPEFDAMMGGYFALNAALKAEGKLIAGEGLQGTETATSLRIRGGRAETMDGPFAETKERLGGFYLIEVADLDEALAWAAKIPTAHTGTVELRPVMSYAAE